MQIIEHAGHFTGPAAPEANHFVEHLRSADLSVGTYSIPAGGLDDQTPHTEDEIYVVTSGRATLVTDGTTAKVGPGATIFVHSGEAHRFVDVTEDLALLVLFAPPFQSREGAYRTREGEKRSREGAYRTREGAYQGRGKRHNGRDKGPSGPANGPDRGPHMSVAHLMVLPTMCRRERASYLLET